VTENRLALMPTESASTERGPSRRDVLLAGLALPALGGGIGVSSLLLSDPARAASPGQCVFGVTQEAVNFNPLLYVNTGVETAVEMTVFDSLWKIDPQGKFVPNLAAEIPTVENGGISKDGLTWTIKLHPDARAGSTPSITACLSRR
jgi:peptide/nickel transport system substrate-binding protein